MYTLYKKALYIKFDKGLNKIIYILSANVCRKLKKIYFRI